MAYNLGEEVGKRLAHDDPSRHVRPFTQGDAEQRLPLAGLHRNRCWKECREWLTEASDMEVIGHYENGRLLVCIHVQYPHFEGLLIAKEYVQDTD